MSNSPKQNNWQQLPMEYWMLIGFAVAASRLGWEYLAVIGCYLFLKSSRPLIDWELLLVTSILSGMRVAGIIQMFVRGRSFYDALEPLIVIIVALTFFYTRSRVLAWLLLVYTALGVIFYPVIAAIRISKIEISPYAKDFLKEYVILFTVLNALLVWLIWRWLHRLQASTLVLVVKETITPSEPESRAVENNFEEHEEVVDAQNQKLCVACEKAIPENSHFCPKCGYTQPGRV